MLAVTPEMKEVKTKFTLTYLDICAVTTTNRSKCFEFLFDSNFFGVTVIHST